MLSMPRKCEGTDVLRLVVSEDVREEIGYGVEPASKNGRTGRYITLYKDGDEQ